MRIHFIAIGGNAMHNLAIVLHKKGYEVTGSDDEIVEPSRSRLAAVGLLPAEAGWFPEKIDTLPDAIVLGMHARADNPELRRAQELNIRIFSYPEFLYEQTKDKVRVVIGGSHGKTTITSMIMHVLKENGMQYDYMAGAQVEGFDTMVGLSNESAIAVFEGDEYPSSPADLRPKFHIYHPNIALISGIAWDHINVFPTFEIYTEQFREFVRLIEPGGKLVYYQNDPVLKTMAEEQDRTEAIGYNTHPYVIRGQVTCLQTGTREIPLRIFGEHNLQNISGALQVCRLLGVPDNGFYDAISTFTGAAKRLEIISENNHTTIFRDFAHSPSKLLATTSAVKKQFPGRQLVACMELHTFSSLKKDFLPNYRNSMEEADIAFVYFNPRTVEHKKLEPITPGMVYEGFGKSGLLVTTNSDELFERLAKIDWKDKNLLMMSSGNFDGKDLKELAIRITG